MSKLYIGVVVDTEGYADGEEAWVCCVSKSKQTVQTKMYKDYVETYDSVKDWLEEKHLVSKDAFCEEIETCSVMQFPDFHIQFEMKEIDFNE